MRRFLFLVLFLFLICPAARAQTTRITATITVTNGTVNGDDITINGTTRTWTNSVVLPNTQILTNDTALGAKTNLLTQLGMYPVSGVILSDVGTNSFRLIGASGLTLTVTPSADWAEVSYSTQAVVNMVGVRVPVSGEPSSDQQNYIASQLLLAVNDLATNAFNEASGAVANLVGITNAQTVSGAKTFTNMASIWYGVVSNSPAISGDINTVSNGVWWSGALASPSMTNGANFGNAFRSPGSGADSEQFGTGASAAGASSVALGKDADASGDEGTALGTAAEATALFSTAVGTTANATAGSATALGNQSLASKDAATAVGYNAQAIHTNATAIGYNSQTTAADQVRIGSASDHVSIPGYVRSFRSDGTNTFAGDVSFVRYSLSSLANGNNAAVPVGTNVFVEVSGPTGAFTINGINAADAQRDGKLIIILNQTGQDMTIAHQSGTDPAAANRIISMTGADRATTGNGTATLIYSSAASRWILIAFDP